MHNILNKQGEKSLEAQDSQTPVLSGKDRYTLQRSLVLSGKDHHTLQRVPVLSGKDRNRLQRFPVLSGKDHHRLQTTLNSTKAKKCQTILLKGKASEYMLCTPQSYNPNTKVQNVPKPET